MAAQINPSHTSTRRQPNSVMSQTIRPRLTPMPNSNTCELVASAQQELTRLGCFSGDIDGELNDATRAAIKRYLSQKGTRTDNVAITEPFVLELDKQQSRVCPLTCPSGKTAKGDVCVASPQPQPSKPTRVARPSNDDDDTASAPSSRRQQKGSSSGSGSPPPKQKAAAAAPKPPAVHQQAAAPRAPAPARGSCGGGSMIGVGF